MEIKIGNYYSNKTWKYLLPCVRGHGEEFVAKFNSVYKLAFGIHDTLVSGTKFAEGKNIFIMLDRLVQPADYEIFMEWIKLQEYYVTSYCPDADILRSRKQMVVIRVPEVFINAYDHFLKGEYSAMYLDKEIETLFNSSLRREEYKVLKKDKSLIPDFIKKIKVEFGTEITAEDLTWAELELPLKRSEEIFNYEGESSFIYVHNKIEKEEYEYNFD